MGGIVKSSCLIVDDSAICGSYESNRLDRVDIESADCIWSTRVDGSILASPLLINEKEAVICTLRGCVYKINVDTGDQVWRQNLSHPVFGTPLLKDNRVLVPSVDSSIYLLDTGRSDKQDFPKGFRMERLNILF